ncbi:DUF4212 domain-containing protein [Massilia sp. TS11]|uniref:DUF4212 domain-containing protein n=1 Tax=Massilia sp. TS11 TaxID=2908003 RepID=UPI001EDC3ACC|nr:DUF4212 domain-containing protein [Massilia sp. TS11]MCG2586455.1 DUF4212 domain-containing protein [Massilia sp. TS11]
MNAPPPPAAPPRPARPDPVLVAAVLARRARHWQRVRRLSFGLLAVWLLATVGTVWFARELQGITLFGWPLSFYFAAQGAALVYLILIGVYALAMRRLDALGREDT